MTLPPRLKQRVLQLESAFFGLAPARWLAWVVSTLVMRIGWLWGRWRFAAMVRNKGLGCVCHWSVDLKHPENLVLGERVVIGVNVTLGAHSTITLGDHARISKDVVIETAGLDFSTGRPPYRHVSAPITIGAGAWIGTRSIILGGVTIGRNAVVAAGSVITRDVPDGATAAGVPARVIRINPKAKASDPCP